MSKSLVIGIDSGVNTGLAICHIQGGLQEVKSMKILNAFDRILELKDKILFVVVEDARQVIYKVRRERAQGAGSVKRDATIWEDFLKKHEIPFKMVRPNKRITKLTSKQFAQITGWSKPTNEHSRDAAMLSIQSVKYLIKSYKFA